MNELLVLFDTARSIAWVAFGATLLLFVGLTIFGGRKAAPVEHEREVAPERKAA